MSIHSGQQAWQIHREQVVIKRRYKLGATFALAAILSPTAFSAEYSGARTIVDMGCDNVDTICYIDLSGAPVGATVGCSSNYIVWDSVNDPNGKNTLASLLAAFVSGKQINVYINSCLAARPANPTMWYFTVYN